MKGRDNSSEVECINPRGNYADPDHGKAFVYFDLDASDPEITDFIPDSRQVSKSHLDEALKGTNSRPGDYRIMSRKRLNQRYEREERPLSNMTHAVEVSRKGASNGDIARDLGDTLNNAHRRFNRDQEQFTGAIVYEEDGKYHFRE